MENSPQHVRGYTDIFTVYMAADIAGSEFQRRSHRLIGSDKSELTLMYIHHQLRVPPAAAAAADAVKGDTRVYTDDVMRWNALAQLCITGRTSYTHSPTA